MAGGVADFGNDGTSLYPLVQSFTHKIIPQFSNAAVGVGSILGLGSWARRLGVTARKLPGLVVVFLPQGKSQLKAVVLPERYLRLLSKYFHECGRILQTQAVLLQKLDLHLTTE